MSILVLKVGGSLLSLPDLPERLAALVASFESPSPLLVIGGGPAADIVREWQSTHRLDESISHDLALQAMALNAQLVADLFPRTTLVANRDQANRAWRDGQWGLLDVDRFLSTEEPRQPLALPHTWQATSDAIAAWVTIAWPADRLVLLKSTDKPAVATPDTLAAAGLIDPCLATWSDRLPRVDWVNLRSTSPRPIPWLS
ncbi:MAG: hypothetical protein VB859_04690 [Planctomycetaceae bacterium]